MSVPTMQQAMASDLSALFAAEFNTGTALINGVEYQCLVGDKVVTQNDAYGGPEGIDLQEVHIQTAALKSVPDGETFKLTIYGETGSRIVVSTTTSADNNELIIHCRHA
jgi:hypothetical protein